MPRYYLSDVLSQSLVDMSECEARCPGDACLKFMYAVHDDNVKAFEELAWSVNAPLIPLDVHSALAIMMKTYE